MKNLYQYWQVDHYQNTIAFLQLTAYVRLLTVQTGTQRGCNFSLCQFY